MPNDNKLPNTGDDQQANQSNPTTSMDDSSTTSASTNNTATLPPIMVSEEALPPMPQMDNSGSVTIDSVKTDATVTSPSNVGLPTDTGSAAPANDIIDTVMPAVVTSTPKKKFAGGKVIATILGLFLLVGGIGAGVFLTGQNQNISEKASDSGNTCFDDCRETKGTNYCNNLCNTNYNPSGGNNSDPLTAGCAGDEIACNVTDVNGNAHHFCIPSNSTSNCQNEAVSQGITLQTGGDGPGVGGWRCIVGQGKDYPYVASQPCVEGNSVQSGLTVPPSCFCGTIQIDGGAHPGTYQSTCGCGNEETLPTPSAPAVTAVCQNVKAYSETWTLLTATQLSQLNATDKVNFCVAGVATGGSFDKAKFTINSAVQAETTTVRPSSTDYCQLYTIPAATTAFTVSAQIHHVTLGYK